MKGGNDKKALRDYLMRKLHTKSLKLNTKGGGGCSRLLLHSHTSHLFLCNIFLIQRRRSEQNHLFSLNLFANNISIRNDIKPVIYFDSSSILMASHSSRVVERTRLRVYSFRMRKGDFLFLCRDRCNNRMFFIGQFRREINLWIWLKHWKVIMTVSY